MGRRPIEDYVDEYFYQGRYMTIDVLMQYSQGISMNTVLTRLQDGWDAEAALKPQKPEGELDPKWHNKDLVVSFAKTLGGVFPEMQPQLNKPYVAYYNRQTYSKHSAKHFFVIHLENGKKLIVYPHEFNIIREAFPAGKET